jgi:hypothetical protein
MSEGLLFAGEEPLSAQRFNAKCIFRGTGLQCSLVSPSAKVPVLMPTTTESGFIEDIPRFANSDFTEYTPIRIKHLHSELDTDEDGGRYYDILQENTGIYVLDKVSNNRVGNWTVETALGATVVTDTSGSTTRIRMRTETANANAVADIFDGTLKVDLEDNVIFMVKERIDLDTDILWRSGVGIEKASAATSLDPFFGMEGCSGDGINYMLVTCNGIARTKHDSLIGYKKTSTNDTVKLTHLPADKLQFELHTGQIVGKTTNVSSSGQPAENRTNAHGIKSTNTTSKNFYVYASMTMAADTESRWF